MTGTSRLRELVLAKLVGRTIDVVGFMDELLDLSQEVGAIRCSLSDENSLRFDMPNADSCEIKVDACRGKLRMLCARLHVLCAANVPTSASSVSPYGGEGIIEKTPASRNGKANSDEPRQWTVRFKNTPSEQEFTVTSIKTYLGSLADSVEARR